MDPAIGRINVWLYSLTFRDTSGFISEKKTASMNLFQTACTPRRSKSVYFCTGWPVVGTRNGSLAGVLMAKLAAIVFATRFCYEGF